MIICIKLLLNIPPKRLLINYLWIFILKIKKKRIRKKNLMSFKKSKRTDILESIFIDAPKILS